MLNIGRLAAGGAEYYLTTVASGVEDYYTGAGEAPGYWLGEASAALGLSGVVDADALHAVLGGADPATGEPLGRKPRTRPGYDLTFRAPKSVSILWGLADRDTVTAVRAAHDTAVRGPRRPRHRRPPGAGLPAAPGRVRPPRRGRGGAGRG